MPVIAPRIATIKHDPDTIRFDGMSEPASGSSLVADLRLFAGAWFAGFIFFLLLIW